MSSTVQYVVKLPTNNNVLVSVPTDSTIQRVKQEIYALTKIPINEQKLLLNDNELVNDITVVTIPPLSTLTVIRVSSTVSKGTVAVNSSLPSASTSSTFSSSSTGSSALPSNIPNLTPALPVNEEEEACTICLETYAPEFPPVTLKCKHGFHEPCIKEWCKNSRYCPLCRAPIELLLVPGNNNGSSSSNSSSMSTSSTGSSSSSSSNVPSSLLSIPAAIVASVTPSILYSWKTTTTTPSSTLTTTTPFPGTTTTVTTITIPSSETPPSVEVMARLLNETRSRIMNNPEYSVLRAAVANFAIQFAARGARTLYNSSLAGTAVTIAGIALQNSSLLRNVASTAARSVVQGTLRDLPMIGRGILTTTSTVQQVLNSPTTAIAATALATASVNALAPGLFGPTNNNNYNQQQQQQQIIMQQQQQQQQMYTPVDAVPVAPPPPRAFIVRCPNCQQLLHTPDAPVFRCTCGAFLSR